MVQVSLEAWSPWHITGVLLWREPVRRGRTPVASAKEKDPGPRDFQTGLPPQRQPEDWRDRPTPQNRHTLCSTRARFGGVLVIRWRTKKSVRSEEEVKQSLAQTLRCRNTANTAHGEPAGHWAWDLGVRFPRGPPQRQVGQWRARERGPPQFYWAVIGPKTTPALRRSSTAFRPAEGGAWTGGKSRPPAAGRGETGWEPEAQRMLALRHQMGSLGWDLCLRALSFNKADTRSPSCTPNIRWMKLIRNWWMSKR